MKRRLLFVIVALLLLLAISLPLSNVLRASTLISVTTQRYNLNRNSVNTQETTLNTSNVNYHQFGMLFTLPVTGEIYAQPLIVPGVNIPGKGVHNVLYIGTSHNMLYAFDADTAGPPLWTVNFGNPFADLTILVPTDITGGEDGILSTPVIDTSTGTIYVVTHHEQGNPANPYDPNAKPAQHIIHALDMTTGHEKFGGPTVITATVPATGADSVNGKITYDAHQELQRPALTLTNGRILVMMGSSGDNWPFHGWMYAYNASNLQAPPAVWLASAQGGGVGLWTSGTGAAVDQDGYIYTISGNGTFNADQGGTSYGDSFVKLKLDTNANTLSVVDYFSPWNQAQLDQDDNDLGVSGPVLIPGTHLLFGGGKSSTLYLVDTNNMGHFKADNDSQIVQEWEGKLSHLHNSPNIWTGPDGTYAYVFAESDYMKLYEFINGKFNTIPVSTSDFKNNGMPSGEITISSNGRTPGTGIAWSTDYASNFRAVDATNLNKVLWTDSDDPFAKLGVVAKFVPPTVANGKVYMATRSNRVDVYGLFPPGPSGGSLTGLLSRPPAANVDLTAEGTLDWAHWSLNQPTDYDHKANVTPMISNVAVTGFGPLRYTDNHTAFTWSDGTPTQMVNAPGTQTGIYSGAGAIPATYQITVPADTTSRVLKVYVGLWNAQGRLDAWLSDRSAPPFSDSFQNLAVNDYGMYSLSYKAASAGQSLIVRWSMTGGPGNITFQAATLSQGGPLPTPTILNAEQLTFYPTFLPPTNTSTAPKTATPTPVPTGGPSPTPPPPDAFRAQYEAINTRPSESQIRAGFNVVNLTSGTANLSDFKVRYYFTEDGGDLTNLSFTCEFAVVGCNKVTGTFGTVNPAVSGADTYMELGFTGGTLPGFGGSSGQVLVHVSKNDNSQFNQSDDFSFDDTMMSFADSRRISLFQTGTLIWGAIPGGGATTAIAPAYGSTVNVANPTFQWTNIPNITRYQLRVTSPGNSPVLLQWYNTSSVCSGTTCSVTMPSALTNNSYLWQVETSSSAGDGPWSPNWPFTVALP